MKNLMDLHTHTIQSVHAYSTLRENAKRAREMGLKVLGTSDHGYGAKGTSERSFFTNYHVIPRYMEDVRILKGIELNIGDIDGSVIEQELIDWKKKYEEPFDYTIGSIHRNAYREKTSDKENTNAYLRAIENDDIDIIGHIDDGNIPANFDEIMHKAREFNKAIEVNNTSCKKENYRKDSIENIYRFLEYGKKYGTLIIMNSDAHIDHEVGGVDLSEKLILDVGYSKDLVVNYSLDLLAKLLNKGDIFEK